MIYLDDNATRPLIEPAKQAMLDAMEQVAGNPSSVHQIGRKARQILDKARAQVAKLAGVNKMDHVVFTGSGSEANNLMLGWAYIQNMPIFVSEAEHLSLYQWVKEGRAHKIKIHQDGMINLEYLKDLLMQCQQNNPNQQALISIQAANNETGILQDIDAIAKLIESVDGKHFFHVDAVQIPGKQKLSSIVRACHSVSLSAHKMGGPQGVGALVFSQYMPPPHPLILGGGQEGGWRAGTQNMIGIAGMGAVSDYYSNGECDKGLQDYFETKIQKNIPACQIIGKHVLRLANTSCIAIKNIPSDMMVIALDLKGFAVSAGSACSSGKPGNVHVLDAMNLPDGQKQSAFRVSYGPTTTKDDLSMLIDACVEVEQEWKP